VGAQCRREAPPENFLVESLSAFKRTLSAVDFNGFIKKKKFFYLFMGGS